MGGIINIEEMLLITLQFTIKGQQLCGSVPRMMVADTINFFEAQFYFSEPCWNGLSKWAHFKQGDTVYDFLLDENDCIKAEKGLNLPAGQWLVYLHGTENKDGVPVTRITTHTFILTILPSECMDGEPMPPLPPSAAEQIEALAQEAKLMAQSVCEDAAAGVFRGEKGEKGDKGETAGIECSAKGLVLFLNDSADSEVKGLKIYGRSQQEGTPSLADPKEIINIGDVTVGFYEKDRLQPYQSMKVCCSNGLPGLEVSDPSLATYTDESGRMWCADEVDFARGVYVQRVYCYEFDGTEAMLLYDNSTLIGKTFKGLSLPECKVNIESSVNNRSALLSNIAEVYTQSGLAKKTNGVAVSKWNSDSAHLYFNASSFGSVEQFRALAAEAYANGEAWTIQYVLQTPVEFPLSDKQLAAYAALHTVYPCTEMRNDKGAFMEVTYLADSVKYIGSVKPKLRVKLPVAQAEITVCKGETVFKKRCFDSVTEFELNDYGVWAVSAAVSDGSTAGTQVTVDCCKIYEVELDNFESVFGVEWDGTSTTKWNRTDAAADFTDPVPYYVGMTAEPTSPFDNFAPWNKIRRVSDEAAGELVEIPKYWYKWTSDGVKMKLQVSSAAADGFHVSPAHADRGDGQGERDVVYVGRYHCSSDYRSKTREKPKVNITRAVARSGIHALGEDIWQYDYAMFWTIAMLYLVEYADWNSQSVIGYGCGNGSATEAVGKSDAMPYHSGTMQSSKKNYSVGCQYRWIEGLWENVCNWCDGICLDRERNVYVDLCPSAYSEETKGTLVGVFPETSGYIIKWSVPEAPLDWALIPMEVSSENVAVSDKWLYESEAAIVFMGAYYDRSMETGLYSMMANKGINDVSGVVGCRLMKLPNRAEVSE